MHQDFFDNRARILKDDLAAVLENGGTVSVASSVFSMYAYRTLREQLDGIDEFRFIFTSPTFLIERDLVYSFYPAPVKSGGDTRMAKEKNIAELEAEVAKLERRYAKEVQPAKRNAAFKEFRAAKAALLSLKGE